MTSSVPRIAAALTACTVLIGACGGGSSEGPSAGTSKVSGTSDTEAVGSEGSADTDPASGSVPASSSSASEISVPPPTASAGGGSPGSTAPDTLDRRARSLLLKGQKVFQEGNYERAMALLDSAEIYAPGSSVVPFNRGRVYTALNRMDRARSAFLEAIRRNRNYPEARLRLGNIERQRGNLNAALELYRQEARLDPTSALYVRIGETFQRLNQGDSARVAYERAIDLDAENANAHMMYGQFLEETGDLEEALTHSREALAQRPGRPNYHFAVGSQLFQLGRLEEAVPHLKEAADTRLLHYPAQYNLGQALMRLGRQEEADRYLARADSSRALMDSITALQTETSRRPDAPDLWIRLGELFREAGERERAVQAFNRAASLEPGNLRMHRNVGEMMLTEGDAEGAIRRFRSILNADRSRVEVWRDLAVAYARAGNCAEAERTVQTARKIRPGDPRLDGVLEDLCP